MQNCTFCSIIAGDSPKTLIYEDDEAIVIKDIHPKTPIHWLIIPKKHIIEFVDLQPPEVDTLMRIAHKMVREHNLTRYRIINNGGGRQEIDHVHIHVMGEPAKDVV